MSSATGHEWMSIRSTQHAPARSQLLESTLERSIINFQFDGFFLDVANTPKGPAMVVSLDEGTPILESGSPDLPKLTSSVIIPDLARMDIRVIHSAYTDFHDIFIAPSKGNLTRDIDPESVPYVFGKTYSQNEFFPGTLAQLQTPYILRDYRGQTIIVFPFQYNPVSRTLRVYNSITIEIKQLDEEGINPLIRHKETDRVDVEFNRIYERHFMNLQQVRYTPVEEQGNMLVICYGDFMDEMEPFVEWKQLMGIPIEMVDVAAIGNASQIKTYVEDYYTTNGLTFLLLVGDAGQVPTHPYGGVPASDNSYGFILGDDSYAEVFVGRFSAETPDQVTTQVERVINYEKNPLISTDWFTRQAGIASSQGPGDDNEMDYDHMRNIQSDLLNYTYTYGAELFDGTQGNLDAPGNPTPSMVAAEINAGVSMITYTGHGSIISWGTSGFSNTNVDQLTNTQMLPFIWSVACSNGVFAGSTCFAEAWMRATDDNGEPAGAIATLMSTISQSWDPPMDAQDEMIDILVESYPENIKRTFGGISFNGCMKMNDDYGSDGSYETNAWTCFGDPSLVVRTAIPQELTVTHNPEAFLGSTQFVVNCTTDGALVGLTIDDLLIGSAIVQDGMALIEFEPLLLEDTLTIVTTAYNYLPTITEIPISHPDGPYVIFSTCSVNDTQGNANGLVDYGEQIMLTVDLSNVGIEEATGVTTVLTCSNPYITLLDNSETYGNILPDSNKIISDAFSFQVSSEVSDGDILLFSLQINGSGGEMWTSHFTLVAHAPVLTMGTLTILDPEGNNNGRLDPGESAQIIVQITNKGTSEALNVQGLLSSTDEYITINQALISYGNITGNGTGEGTFTVTPAEGTPPGHPASFSFTIDADQGLTGSGSFTSVVGQIPVLILDLDPNHSSGPVMHQTIQDLGITCDYLTTIPADLNLYASVFVCLGVYSSNHVLTQDEGNQLAGYLNLGGKLYMEGADTWAYNMETPVHDLFLINGVQDGSADLSAVYGLNETFAEEMIFTYSGENSYIDHLEPLSPAFLLFMNQSPAYGCAVANDAGTYRTIGTSFEFAGLTDTDTPSTKTDLMIAYLDFFGIQVKWGSATGNVTEAGTGYPISGAQVSVGIHHVFTNEEGLFSGTFPVGDWSICAAAAGHEMMCESITIFEDSAVIRDFTLAYLPPPSNLQVTLNENIATLTWELATERLLTNYHVYRSKDDGTFEMIATPVELNYNDALSLSGIYRYYVTAIYDEINESEPTNMVTVEFTATGISNPDLIPQCTRLGSNYPNPFNETTRLRFDLSRDGDVFIEIYGISGEKIRTLMHENALAGQHEVEWDGKDHRGMPVPPGVYIFQLKSGNYIHSRKMVLMR
ncbi:MAG: T9SS type A sorting domain-containing protein [Lentimicrobiaceae bacterium]|nr:T9SS type A sorting domain-containing protein [Lentimicrobiaceae bacterium]